jgi:HAD superfamily hydrolase (TIGR01509 family)
MAYSLVIFDMDGTLTEDLLDFAAIRAEIGLPVAGPILEAIARLSPEEQKRAHAILERHEHDAAEASVLHDGAVELLGHLRERGLKTALLTRNSEACVQIILRRHGLVLDHVATRADLPYKPHPDSILNIVRRFGVDPRQTLMVGDYLYDLQAANAAAVDSVLLCVRNDGQYPDFASQATYRVHALREILGLVDACRER